MMMDYLRFTVGEKFDHAMPDESMSIMLNGGTPVLAFNFSVTEKNIEAFLNGITSFGLFAENNILFILYKIDGFLDWSDLAFTIHLAGGEKIVDDGTYLPFNILLIESGTKIIKGIRIVTASPKFRTIFTQLITEQNTEQFDTIAYYKKISQIYENHPKTFSMLAKSLITERGGLTLRE